MAAYPGLAAFHTATRSIAVRPRGQASSRRSKSSSRSASADGSHLAVRPALPILAPPRAGPSRAPTSPSGEPEFSTRPLEKFQKSEGPQRPWNPRGGAPRKARAIGASAQIRPDKPAARHRRSNVACWGISGRAGSMVLTSACSQQRTFECSSTTWILPRQSARFRDPEPDVRL